jgi:Tol biopolymer transport system component
MALSRLRTGVLGAVVLAVAWAPTADATFPGRGGEILFHKSGPEHGTWAVHSRSGELRQITESRRSQEAQWAPDSETIALVDNEDIALLRDGDKENITQTPKVAEFGPSFSGPHGDRITFSAYETGGVKDGRPHIWVMNADGTNRRRLTSGGRGVMDSNPAFSADGSHIAFTRSKKREDGSRVCVMGSDGSRRECFGGPGYDYAPSFSPNGNSIVFTRYAAFGSKVFRTRVVRLKLKTGALRYITPAALEATDPVFSPSGYRIAFIAYNERRRSDVIYASNLDGSKTPRVTPKRFDSQLSGPLSWAPR